MTTPLIQAVKLTNPNAQITVICGSTAAETVLLGSPYCDQTLVMPRKILDILVFFLKIRLHKFDLAIIATRLSSIYGWILKYIAAVPTVWGGGIESKPIGYTFWADVDKNLHRVDANMEIIKHQFNTIPFLAPIFSLSEEDKSYAKKQIQETARLKVGIHPGSDPNSGTNKRIPCSLIKDLIKYDQHEGRFIFYLFIGPKEVDLASEFMDISGGAVVLVQEKKLSFVAAMISQLNFMISGDTGLGHVASAVGVPVITLAGPTEIGSTRPWGAQHRVIRTDEHLPCMPCYNTNDFIKCRLNLCMSKINVYHLIREIDLLVKNASI